MATTYCSAIAILPPPEVSEPIQLIRREFDRQIRRWMPHINIVYPFRPREQFEALLRPLAIACRAIEPFEIELKEFNSFVRQQDSVMWLKPQPADRIAALHDALFEVVPDCDHVRCFEEGFTPHLSVGQVTRKKYLQGTIRRLQESWRPAKFMVRQVAILWRDAPPNDVFAVAHTIPLG